ncbi:28995_t:CDS:2, partial [Gigaspora margarita]
MFLSRLKKNNATFVAITTPKSLSEAIIAARRVEAGIELNELKKRIDNMAINYVALKDKFKGINKSYNRNNSYQRNKMECYNCDQNQVGMKETFNQTRNINFCEVMYNNGNTKKEIYNVEIELNSQKNEEEEDFNSEGEDTFDEFDYEEEKELDEVEGCFIEEYHEEYPALFLTNIEEVPMKEQEKKNSVESKIKQVIKNDDLTLNQDQQDAYCAKIKLNSWVALPGCSGRKTHIKKKFFFVVNQLQKIVTEIGNDNETKFKILEIIILPQSRAAAVERVKTAQKSAKVRYDQQLRSLDDLQKGNKVLVYKASQEHSKSYKLYPKWKGPFIVHKVLTKGVFKLRTTNGNVIKTPINRCFLK